MTINKNKDGEKLFITLEGRLDTVTSPQLEAEIKENIEGVRELVFDFAELQYISSAGLRVILLAQKIMNDQGKMLIKNVNEDVMEVFEITGFLDIVTIE